ncbi:hypothetical protein F511_31364 [Dorcoceras hygrometricum]|uniref:Uncharacterized protein n=1 Tax=Dorcoceras hygrometricum TaxID=472368 RepID=A0A2Z7CGQ0_9LAMI|nr:hypothetical protein F511_31364 [Dorcoceras hygrometricum]
MVKRLATSPHDPIGITDSACKNQLVVVSVQYGPFNTYIPIRSTTIGKSRVARDPIAMHTSWRSNSDIASVTSIGYPRMRASGESSTTKHRLLHASGPHPIPPPNDPNIGYPRMRASGESSTTKHRLPHASGPHPIPPPNDPKDTASRGPTTCVTPKPHFGLAHQIMVKRLAKSPHDPLGITDRACKNQLVMVSVQYGPFNTYIPIRSTTIGKSRVARDPITMQTSRRSNSDIACVTSIGYPRTKASGESWTTKHRLLHASGPHPIPPPDDPNRVGKRVKVRHLSCKVSMTFRVVMANLYNQDLGLIHSTNDNHLESPNEGSSIDHQVTIHLHAQNITMFPTNETWYFTSQMLVSSSGDLILILTAQSTRNEFRIHSDY